MVVCVIDLANHNPAYEHCYCADANRSVMIHLSALRNLLSIQKENANMHTVHKFD